MLKVKMKHILSTLCPMSVLLVSLFREMEEADWDSLDASRTREKGADGHPFLSLSQKGSLKTSSRAFGSRRARRTFSLFT